MRAVALVTLILAVVFASAVLIFTGLRARPPVTQAERPSATQATPGMPGMAGPSPAASPMLGMAADAPRVPPVKGFSEGQEVFFIHTEASDPQVAQMLTDMMGSPVLVVPSLAQAPQAMLADVYVFTNGVQGEGPFGFQPDVFDKPPGDRGYTPLRAVNLVAWTDESAARVLKSVHEVQEAQAKGQLTIERPGAVVNMPLLTWPSEHRGGHR